MRKLLISQLKPGMEVARTIYAAGGQVLLKAGTILSNTMIRRLYHLNIIAVYVEDGLLPDVEIDDVILEETRAEATAHIKEMLEIKTANKIRKLRVGEELKRDIVQILEQILDSPTSVVKLSDIRTIDDYTFGHSVNVCVLSILTGTEMNYSKEELFHLGVGAILHDVGKINVPEKVLNKPGSLSENDFKIIKRHTEDGFQILKYLKDISSASANIALQHHERYGGDGYPKGLKGDEISRFARIAAVTDVFDALTSNRVYRSASPPHEAMEMLMGGSGFHFDHRVVRAFYQRVAAYPTGSFLQLGSGEIAAVVDTPKGQPLRPTVRVMFGVEGELLSEPYEIALSEELKIVINRIVLEEEIGKLLSCRKIGGKMI